MANLRTYTALQIIDRARFLLDRDGTADGITNAQLLPILDDLYEEIRRALGEIAPDLYTARKEFTISSGSSWTISISPDDFGKIMKLERQVGSDWVPLAVAPLLTAEVTPGYRLRGSVIDIFPSTDAIASYRLTYETCSSAELTATSDTLTLPKGASLVIAARLASACRPRFDEDSRADDALAIAKWTALVEGLVDQYRATPQQIASVY